MTKFCKNCKYYKVIDFGYRGLVCKSYLCAHPDARSIVTGQIEYECSSIRNDEDLCGVKGKLYEQKIEEPKPVIGRGRMSKFFKMWCVKK